MFFSIAAVEALEFSTKFLLAPLTSFETGSKCFLVS